VTEQSSSADDQAQPAPPPPPHATTHTGLHHAECPPLWAPKTILWVLFFLALTLATRCANYRSIFVPGAPGTPPQVFFAQSEGDCYSRMTRVRQILEHGGIVHHHAWENFPLGTWPHTTLLMDYLIAAIALLLKPFTGNYIDYAGAIVSPLLGVATTAFLAFWARELNQQYRRLMLLLASLSPILVHGTELGRPRHLSLEIFLVAVGLGAELIMARKPQVAWSIVSGIAWGLALWVSLFEPLVILVVIYLTKLIFYRPSLFVKERLWGVAIFAAILAIAYALDGRFLVKNFTGDISDPALRTYFTNWASTIEELKGLKSLGANTFSDFLFYWWVGWGLLVSPLLLIARLRDTKRSVLLLALLVVTFLLTLQWERFGYFFALVYAMSLPWQLSIFRRKWLVWLLFLLSLWPVARQWDYWLFDQANQDMNIAQLNDQRRLRQAAEFIKEKAPGGILAPWWWSPQLVYWSGQPAVAGSSHESLAGIVDTSLFFSTTDPVEAQAVCDQRHVETVVTGNPGDIVELSVQILGMPFPIRQNTMADILWEKPHSAPLFLHLVFDNNVVKVFEVNHGYIVR